MVLCTWYGDKHEFRDGAPTADGVLRLLDELAVMLYNAMYFASEAGSLQTGCVHTRVREVLKCEPPIHSIPIWSNQL